MKVPATSGLHFQQELINREMFEMFTIYKQHENLDQISLRYLKVNNLSSFARIQNAVKYLLAILMASST
jgi:hypothetical protein